jgi:hypothetical protein
MLQLALVQGRHTCVVGTSLNSLRSLDDGASLVHLHTPAAKDGWRETWAWGRVSKHEGGSF